MAKGNQHPLDSDRGTTVVEQPVVTSIVSTVTREAEKVQNVQRRHPRTGRQLPDGR